MKKIFLPFIVIGLWAAFSAFADDAGKLTPPPVNLIYKPSPDAGKPLSLPPVSARPTAPPPDLPGSPKPSDPEKLKVWSMCTALAGHEYKYFEGKLLSEQLYTARNVGGDCFSHCPPVNEKTEHAWYDTQFDISGVKIRVGIGNKDSTTYELRKFDPTFVVGKNYIFCARYWAKESMAGYSIDHMETLREE